MVILLGEPGFFRFAGEVFERVMGAGGVSPKCRAAKRLRPENRTIDSDPGMEEHTRGDMLPCRCKSVPVCAHRGRGRLPQFIPSKV